ncbi:MAG: prolyl oligopeptidase family serine peptidase [Ferruginibacter sp.]
MKRKPLYHLVVLMLLSFSLYAQEKKAITHADMWSLKRVGAPEISADGKWVVFSVLNPAYDEKDQNTDLWLAKVDGGKPRKITSTKAGESQYAWSPDNKTIAFVAKREGDEVAQVYTINIEDGGEAQRVTTLSTGASAPHWSPDGSMLLFTSNVYPGTFADSSNKKIAEEKKKQKYKARVFTTFPIRYWDHWLDEKQAHLFVQKADSASPAQDLFAGSADMVNKEGFSFNGNACWSADGKQVVFVATTEATAAAYKDVAAQVYAVPAGGGAITALTKDAFDYGDVAVSNDGKYLYCQAAAANNYKIYNLSKLVRYNWPSMQGRTVLADKLDRPINNYALSDNSIVLSVETEGNDKIYTITANETEARPLMSTKVGCYSNVAVSDNNIIVADYESAAAPVEIVKANANGHEYISNFNADKLATLDLQPIESFWFTTSRGKKIKNILVRPAGFDPSKKYPLFVVMHGGPAISYKDNFGYRWNYHLLSAPGYVLVLTDYTGSTGYGEKFTQDIQNDPFKGPADEINEAAAYAVKHYSFIDGTLQAAGGASYGGHLTNWMQATTTHYKCLISHAGLVNSEDQWGTSDGIYGREVMNGGTPWSGAKSWKEQNPIRNADKFKTPILVTVGEQDYRVPLNNSIENWHVLQRMKVPSKLIVFPEENHWILKGENSKFFYQEVHNWLKKYLVK